MLPQIRFTNTNIQNFVVSKIFERSLISYVPLKLFGQKHSKDSNIVKYY